MSAYGRYMARGGGSPPDITPSSFSGLILWLDATDTATITKDGSDKVSAWADKSTSSNNFVQATGANQPTYTASGINSTGSITFNGTTSQLHSVLAATPTTYSIYIVTKPTANRQYAAILDCGNTGTYLTFEEGVQNSIDIYVNNVGAAGDTGLNSFSANGVKLISYTYTFPSLVTYLNNTSNNTANIAQANTLNPASIALGNNNASGAGFYPYTGLIGEVIMYDNQLSTNNQDSLYNNYLKDKWGLP